MPMERFRSRSASEPTRQAEDRAGVDGGVLPKARSLFRHAALLRDGRDFAGAARAYRKALRLEPSCAMGWACLAKVHEMAGSLAKAIPFYRRALELRPANEILSASLFFALCHADEHDAARVEAERFLALVRDGRAVCGEDLREDYEAFLTSSAM